MAPQLNPRSKIVIGLGSNHPGPWGTPAETIAHALGEMRRAKIDVAAVSLLYVTAAVGSARQPPYVNAVALLDTRLSPEALLRVLKAIERHSGRRGGRPWGRRTLDLDILDYGGQVRHWRRGRSAYARPSPPFRASAAPRYCARLASSCHQSERARSVAAGGQAGAGRRAEEAFSAVRLASPPRSA